MPETEEPVRALIVMERLPTNELPGRRIKNTINIRYSSLPYFISAVSSYGWITRYIKIKGINVDVKT